ncbi:hypothetical protein BH747_03350 [Enterococcus villorum]|uniref:Uncharacterized protein n=1 Tax=Enterococcus villorum TaxID=112904 RepID=A0A1V8YEN1_9ENTE|nr:hypothetical protein [Enterococcus villorum]OQO71050.1 hypothetical protein BH747_03350 [Enterococcus villorum]OQO76750.1 hypothetical protein BH744_01435 [Enterococcus villorum]
MTFNPGKHVYKFSPNPHNDPWYNKNQTKFYNQAAEAIASIGNSQTWIPKNWLFMINITVHGIDYTLSN